MRFGLFGINVGPCADPSVARRVAEAAEAAGFDSVWTGEHVVLPDPQVPPSPVPPETPFLDPAVCLTWIAAHTRTLKLGTGIIILPQRNPLVLAKELASVDVVSSGRLVFGLGVGYLCAEFDALGIPFEGKGARAMEYLAAMRAVWADERPAYDGRFVAFRGIRALPRPVQRPHPPIVIGGHSPEAFRRAVRHGNGWFGFALDLDGTRACLDGLATAARQVRRPPDLGPLEVSVTPRGRLDADAVRRFAAAGVHRLIVSRPARSGDEMLAAIGEVGALVERR
jgi:probable F420-dependent oxidoreductase